MGQIARCFYYFFMIVVVIRYKTKATARRALTFIVRIFVNDTIAIAVWTSFHVCASMKLHMSSRIRLHQGNNHSALGPDAGSNSQKIGRVENGRPWSSEGSSLCT